MIYAVPSGNLPAQPLTYDYYRNGQRKSMTTSAGVFQYGYDAAGRSTSLVDTCGHSYSWTYTDNNRLQTQTQGNGVSSADQYNAAGGLTNLQNLSPNQVLLSEFGSLHYDGAGNRTAGAASVAQAPAARGTISYTDDAPNQADPLQHKNELTGETVTSQGRLRPNT